MVLNWSWRAQRLQQQPALGHVQHVERADGEHGLAGLGRGTCGCRAAGAAARSRRAGRPSRRRPRSRARRARCAGGSRCSRRGTPSHGDAVPVAERRPRPSADDVDLGAQVRAGRLERALGGVHRAHRVLDGDPLVAAAGAVLLGAARASAGSAPSARAPTCERFSLVETCTVRSALRIASSVTCGVRRGRDEVAAQPDEHRAPRRRASRGSRRPCRGRARAAGRSRTPSASASRKCAGGRSQMPIVRSPCTLEWPRTGHSPAPGLPMLPCSERDVDDLLDRGDRVAVLGDAPSPSR